jgi:DNA invertase Pin-like site-specific DNA recombinase
LATHRRLILIVLGGLAEFEKELIKNRTSEGGERAKARSVRMGRKPKLTPHQQKEGATPSPGRRAVGEIAKTYNVRNSTISRLKPENEKGFVT